MLARGDALILRAHEYRDGSDTILVTVDVVGDVRQAQDGAWLVSVRATETTPTGRRTRFLQIDSAAVSTAKLRVGVVALW
ncbi:hypothetical protein GCM10010124_28770 [Pilimelia terevasa]|uniref:Uncharacterized protein n=1 Tax=Pilimelia terevasa TaxID=53372 RepID=A0A8J3BTF7_9ACTN|nr:hypothetical protein [Pilimelia terevasa]GGK34418.1 hypothetical protein GCM10010124_28770 [Pilimelia terevasa]